MEIDFKAIEEKWRKKWEEAGIFKAREEKGEKKFYCLEMFPYPSGHGLHMGHMRNYAIADCIARFKRMQGFNVLYPAGYDSFGLPAENAALKHGIDPEEWTLNNIKIMQEQQRKLGFSYDWSRLVITCLPDYYKWNQWLFLQLFKKGLAYKKKAAVNFCPKCKTVLANEQVVQGKCWRCKSEVKIKVIEQWFFKITDYAEKLLEGLEKLDWPEEVKVMQRNWIGKSEGITINFKVKDSSIVLPVFTTRPDTLFGVTFIVIAPEHPLTLEIAKLAGKKKLEEVQEFIEKVKKQRIENPATAETEKEGIFLEKYAINPATNEAIPIYTANFVLPDYGTGIIMAVPAHDQRDFEFAKKYGLPIKVVIKPENLKCIVIHGCPSKAENDPKKRTYDKHWIPWLKKELEKRGITTLTPLMPTPWNPKYEEWKKEFEKNEVDENTILVGHSCGAAFLVRWLGETKRRIRKLILVAPWKVPLGDPRDKLYDYEIDKTIKSRIKEIIIFTADDEAEKGKLSVKMFHEALGGKIIELKGRGHYTLKDMGTEEFPELVEAITEIQEAYTEHGILINSDNFNGLKSEEAIKKISSWLEERGLGKRTIHYRLKDWLISRQRYWGTPIPVVYCEKCGIVPVPEEKLPVLLPEKVKFGEGNPLESCKEFIEAVCPKCGSKARRETDTMDTFVDSSWYFLRYCDPKNKEKIFDKSKVEYWMPVDFYIGGIEHATGHLIYSRFITKVLHDLGLLKFDEPFKKLLCQGMVTLGGTAMSKSRGNVVDPIEVANNYGADAIRLFILFAALPEKQFEWSENGLRGIAKFINKVIALSENFSSESSEMLEHLTNKTIKSVTEKIENYRFNFAIIDLMAFADYLEKERTKEAFETLLKMLSPFIPFIAEELWHKLGHDNFISLEKWPLADESKIKPELDAMLESGEKLKEDIRNVMRILEKKGKKSKAIYIYVVPNQFNFYKSMEVEITREFGKKAYVEKCNEASYDPENKAKKAKPGKPSLYIE